eukprot:gene10182-15660_t
MFYERIGKRSKKSQPVQLPAAAAPRYSAGAGGVGDNVEISSMQCIPRQVAGQSHPSTPMQLAYPPHSSSAITAGAHVAVSPQTSSGSGLSGQPIGVPAFAHSPPRASKKTAAKAPPADLRAQARGRHPDPAGMHALRSCPACQSNGVFCIVSGREHPVSQPDCESEVERTDRLYLMGAYDSKTLLQELLTYVGNKVPLQVAFLRGRTRDMAPRNFWLENRTNDE